MLAGGGPRARCLRRGVGAGGEGRGGRPMGGEVWGGRAEHWGQLSAGCSRRTLGRQRGNDGMHRAVHDWLNPAGFRKEDANCVCRCANECACRSEVDLHVVCIAVAGQHSRPTFAARHLHGKSHRKSCC